MAVFDVNKHMEILGCIGRFQLLLIFQTGFMVILFGWSMFVVVFTHSTPPFRCIDNPMEARTTESTLMSNLTTIESANGSKFDSVCEISTVSADNVTVTSTCKNFEYDKPVFQLTVIESYDLICDRQYMSTMSEMIFMAVVGLGTMVGSYLSDRYGRRMICVVCTLTGSVFGVIQAFSVNMTMYTILRTLSGMFYFAVFSPAFALTMESVSSANRPHVLNVLEFFWIFALFSMSLLSYLLRTWWHLQLAVHAPGLIIGIMFIWTIPESPHWYATTGKKNEALALLEKIARWNNQKNTGLSFNPEDYTSTAKLVKDEQAASESFWKVFKAGRLVARFFIFSFAWIACTLCYYALTLGIRELAGSIFLNNFYSALAESVGYAACFSIAWWGRKWPTVAAFSGATIALLSAVLLQALMEGSAGAVTAMGMIGKMFIVMAWQIIIVWSSEIFPTTQRCILSSGIGMFGRVGSVLAPLCLDLHKFIEVPHEELIMPIVFVVLMVVCTFLFMLPPETNRRKLPEFIRDANLSEFPMQTEQKDDNKISDSLSMRGGDVEDEGRAESQDLLEEEKLSSQLKT